MGLLVLFGTGLFGIVLSLGTCFADNSDRALARLLERGIRLLTFAVPVLFVLLYLEATCGLADVLQEVLGTIADNVGSFACRYASSTNSG